MGEDGILPPGSCNDLSEFLAGHFSINSMGLVQDGKTRPYEKPRRKVGFPSESKTDSRHELSGGSLLLTIHQGRQSSEKAGRSRTEGVKATKGSHLLRLYPGFSVSGQGSHGMWAGLEPPSKDRNSPFSGMLRKAGESGRCGLRWLQTQQPCFLERWDLRWSWSPEGGNLSRITLQEELSHTDCRLH